MARLLVVDNYDSFVYVLVQYLRELDVEITVVRNDEMTVADAWAVKPDGVLISPGPGRPEAAGISPAILSEWNDRLPILGVCLGHQGLGAAFGASVVPAPAVMHGKTSEVLHQDCGVFSGLPSPLTVTRYHSLVVDAASIPDDLMVTAATTDGVVMGLQHRSLPLHGVQFHPESVLSERGHDLLANFAALL